MRPRLPQKFGQYTLTELIARGGMAEIYRATIPGVGGFEKTVAIKKILPHLAENDEFITMLIDEAQIIVSINHANIAQVYDLGKIDEDYYIAMEYIHGIDLSTIVKELKETNRTVPVEHALFIGSSIVAGLHVAHNKHDETGRPLHIVHRDVSPHNILISFAGDVKIIDFGVAKARGKNAHTNIGVIKGKLLYMAPEQAMSKPIDGRADLFAAGLILYRMLTNHLPFAGDNEFQIYNNILSKEITPPRFLNPDIPEEVNQIVMMLLQKDPSKRYQDGYSAKIDLDRALQALAPGYSVSRLSRWVEDNFSHLAVRQRQQRSGNVGEIESEAASSTPPGTAASTHEREQPVWDRSGWHDIDEDEDTINVNLDSPEARRVLEQAQRAREAAGVAPWGTTGSGAAPAPQPASASGPGDTGGWTGAHAPPSQPGGVAAPNGSWQPSTTSLSGQYAAVPDFNAAAPASDEAHERKLPPAPAIGIFILLIAIAAMLAYHVIADPAAPDAEAGTVEPGVGGAEEPAAPELVEGAAVEPGAADVVPSEEVAPDEPEEPAEVPVVIESKPAGARVLLGEDELGVTPWSGKLPRGEDPVELTLEKEGFETKSVDVVPFEEVQRDVELVAVPPPEEVKEAAPAVEEKKPAPKPRKKVRKERKKQAPKEEKPTVPLLDLDTAPPAKKSSGSDDVLDPFDL